MIKRNKKYKTLLKVLVHAPLLLLAFILQDMVFTHLPILGARPLVLPVAVAAVAMFEGSVRGGIFGLCAGILCDASLGQPAILCTLVLTLCGVGLGILCETLLARGFPSFLLCAALALVLCTTCMTLPLAVRSIAPLPRLVLTALMVDIYSLLFALPVYLIARSM